MNNSSKLTILAAAATLTLAAAPSAKADDPFRDSFPFPPAPHEVLRHVVPGFDGHHGDRDRWDGRRDRDRWDRDRGRWGREHYPPFGRYLPPRRWHDDRYIDDRGYDRYRDRWDSGRWSRRPVRGGFWVDGYSDEYGYWVPGHWERRW